MPSPFLEAHPKVDDLVLRRSQPHSIKDSGQVNKKLAPDFDGEMCNAIEIDEKESDGVNNGNNFCQNYQVRMSAPLKL